MFKKIPEYKNLERKVIGNSQIKILFKPGDKFELERCFQEGRYYIVICAPWGNIYSLSNYKTEEEQNQAFKKIKTDSKKGLSIRITNCYEAEIL